MESSACIGGAAPPSLLQGVPSLRQARQDHYPPSIRPAGVANSGDLLPPPAIELGERRDPISLEPIISPPTIRRTASIGTSSGRDFHMSLPQIPPPVVPGPALIVMSDEADLDTGISIICPPRNGLLFSPTDESEKSSETGETGRGASGRLATSGAGPAVRKGSPSLSRARLGLGEIRLDLGALRARTERDFNSEAMEVRARKEKFAFFEKDCSRVLEHVFVGSDFVARSREILGEAGITHVLNCVGFVCPEYFPGDIVYKTLWLQDNTAEDITCVLYDVFDYIEGVRESGGRVFVHCCQGVSRSTSLVIAYLMWTQRMEFEEAFRRVKAVRGVASPNMGFACQLLQWQKRVLPPKPPPAATPALADVAVSTTPADTAAPAPAAAGASSLPPPSSKSPPLSAAALPGGVVRQHMYRMAPHSPYDALHLVPKTVPFSRASLDPRGCFLVQVGPALYCWQGRDCHPLMAQQGLATAKQIIKYEDLGGEPVLVMGGQETEGLTYLGQDAKLLDAGGKSSGKEGSDVTAAAAVPEAIEVIAVSVNAPTTLEATAPGTPAAAVTAVPDSSASASASSPAAAAEPSPHAADTSDSHLSPSTLSSTSKSAAPLQPNSTTLSPPKAITSTPPVHPPAPSLPHAASTPNPTHTPASPVPPDPPSQPTTSGSPGFLAFRTSSSIIGSGSIFGAVDRFAQKLRRRSWDRKEAEQLRKIAAAVEREGTGRKERGKDGKVGAEGKGRKGEETSSEDSGAAAGAEAAGGGEEKEEEGRVDAKAKRVGQGGVRAYQRSSWKP
ncbi:hypothetical protein CLOP_g14752 [Closterium sp. NIES-67]|nr:hypothetical protein CLOP_g14752 [Closterium sp. NIES-67]